MSFLRLPRDSLSVCARGRFKVFELRARRGRHWPRPPDRPAISPVPSTPSPRRTTVCGCPPRAPQSPSALGASGCVPPQSRTASAAPGEAPDKSGVQVAPAAVARPRGTHAPCGRAPPSSCAAMCAGPGPANPGCRSGRPCRRARGLGASAPNATRASSSDYPLGSA